MKRRLLSVLSIAMGVVMVAAAFFPSNVAANIACTPLPTSVSPTEAPTTVPTVPTEAPTTVPTVPTDVTPTANPTATGTIIVPTEVVLTSTPEIIRTRVPREKNTAGGTPWKPFSGVAGLGFILIGFIGLTKKI